MNYCKDNNGVIEFYICHFLRIGFKYLLITIVTISQFWVFIKETFEFCLCLKIHKLASEPHQRISLLD